MIEIVFSDSACGSLKFAQHIGEGCYSTGCVSYISLDGSKPTEEEMHRVQAEFEASQRAAWENAVPMGGNTADIYGFSLYLSIGDISEDQMLYKRHEVLDKLFSIFPDEIDATESVADTLIQQAQNTLPEILSRSAAGEPIRIWYSSQPDEACGLCWFMAQLEAMKQPYGDVFLIKLPETEPKAQAIIRHTSWGEIPPEEWIQYLPLQQTASPVFCAACAQKWHTLQKENAPLRAVLNGQLVSMPDTLYDSFIQREIAAQSEIFHEAVVIGNILGGYQLGISDTWIAMRIERMISDGILEPVSQPGEGNPLYHRRLRKKQ
ncbi:MAG: DUF1835 domain-containing protein [Clostridia bacterium]|nr:DUF1835 domain-containing protein [Clostridia bacterium]